MIATGHPASHIFIKEIVEEIRTACQMHFISVSYLTLDNSWVLQFLNHHPTLKTILAYAMQSAYIREVSSNVVVNFFAIFSTLIKEHKISIENVYNMDETGMLIYYFIASDRIYGGRDSNQLCYC